MGSEMCIRDSGHTVGFMPNHYLEFHEDADDIIIIEINIGLDEEETSVTYDLTRVNADLKKLKEIIELILLKHAFPNSNKIASMRKTL